MCLIFFSVRQNPVYKLIIAANRDEFYNRKTEAAHYWIDHPHVLAGKDLEAGGTWLGISRTGRISLLTNYRDPKNIDPLAPSRGKLVTDFLAGQENAVDYLARVEKSARQYNGFNLVVGTMDELHYLSNYSSGVVRMTDGFHGLSNALLDTPWPKVQRGRELLEKRMQQPTVLPADLFEVLADEHRAPDSDLPDTGIGLERERALSSMFIKTPNYGSRCSTVIMVDQTNHVTFEERIFNLEAFAFTTGHFEFDIETA